MPQNGSVKLQMVEAVAHLTFEHPSANALPPELLDLLGEKINQITTDKSIKVVVFRSAGTRTFCAGALLDTLLTIKTIEKSIDFFSGFAKVINAMRKTPQPIVGVAQGKAVGGGVGLLAACDHVMAVEDASLRLSELRLGIGSFVIEPAVVRKMGRANYQKMLWTPQKWHDAQWGVHAGLYSDVFKTLDDLETALSAWIETITACDYEAIVANKSVCWGETQHWNELLFQRARLTGMLAMSKEVQQRLQKLKTK